MLEERLLAIRAELAEAVGAWVVRSDTAKWDLPDNTVGGMQFCLVVIYCCQKDREFDVICCEFRGHRQTCYATPPPTYMHGFKRHIH